MTATPYRVVQWATGSIGQISIRHLVDNPVYELVGVYVTSPEKLGRDAGELAGIPATGVLATGTVDEIVALPLQNGGVVGQPQRARRHRQRLEILRDQIVFTGGHQCSPIDTERPDVQHKSRR